MTSFEHDDAGEQDAGLLAGVPGYEAGGRVERTGLALVHEGEIIYPAPDSAARIVPEDARTGRQEINYYFSVEVVAIGELSEPQMKRIAGLVFDELQDELARRV